MVMEFTFGSEKPIKLLMKGGNNIPLTKAVNTKFKMLDKKNS